ncbi:MAG: 3'-5' exonuclease [Anaerolineae bacterium]|jgi:DNA polymerase-3 subunit epsilon|nr:3'-5' exonuclease [Anaerolineae bacterium]
MSHHENRLAIGARARAVLARPFRLIDSETTGLEDNSELLSFAVIDQTGAVLLSSRIRPQNPIPEDATAIHGIRDEDVADAPRFIDVYPAIFKALDARRWVGYNVNYDMERLRFECARARVLMPRPPRGRWPNDLGFDSPEWVDVMGMFAEFYGERHDYFQSYTWKKLTTAARYIGERHFDLETDTTLAHDALADAVMTLKVLKGMARYE